MKSLVRDLETNQSVDLDEFIVRKGIVVLYFRSHKVNVTPRIEPILYRVIEKWKNRGVSIGVCELGFSGSGLKISDHEIHFYHLPLLFIYHSGSLKYTPQGIFRDEIFDEMFVKMFEEYEG
ncbi:MAG: hypothetical protein ACTSQF_16350 [Candidatus Heimdallarchaeaceae archaeon]